MFFFLKTAFSNLGICSPDIISCICQNFTIFINTATGLLMQCSSLTSLRHDSNNQMRLFLITSRHLKIKRSAAVNSPLKIIYLIETDAQIFHKKRKRVIQKQ